MQTSFIAVYIAAVSFFLTSFCIYTRHANFDLNRFLIFTECRFQHRKSFEWSKSFLIRFPPPLKKSPDEISYPLH